MPLKTKIKGTPVISDTNQLAQSVKDELNQHVITGNKLQINIIYSPTLSPTDKIGYSQALTERIGNSIDYNSTPYIVLYTTTQSDALWSKKYRGTHYHVLIWSEAIDCLCGASKPEAKLFGVFHKGEHDETVEALIRGKQNATKK